MKTRAVVTWRVGSDGDIISPDRICHIGALAKADGECSIIEGIMKLLSATIVQGIGADHIDLETDLPDGLYPFKQHQSLTMRVAKDHGLAYVQQHFPGLPVSVVSAREKRKPFFRDEL